jgi:hypothetical protein
MFSENCNNIFNQSILDYHVTDDVDAQIKNPFPPATIEFLLYQKNWIDNQKIELIQSQIFFADAYIQQNIIGVVRHLRLRVVSVPPHEGQL